MSNIHEKDNCIAREGEEKADIFTMLSTSRTEKRENRGSFVKK